MDTYSFSTSTKRDHVEDSTETSYNSPKGTIPVPVIVEVDDEGNVNLALPDLLALSIDSDSSEDECNSLSDNVVPIITEGNHADIPKVSETNFSHSFSGWVAKMNFLMCADSMCGKEDVGPYCTYDASMCKPFKQDNYGSYVITSINESRAGTMNKSGRVPASISEAYRKGIYCFIPSDKFKGSTLPQDEFLYISKEEEYYASRWNGHLPLVPMSASEAAIQKKILLRRRALVARGVRPSDIAALPPPQEH